MGATLAPVACGEASPVAVGGDMVERRRRFVAMCQGEPSLTVAVGPAWLALRTLAAFAAALNCLRQS